MSCPNCHQSNCGGCGPCYPSVQNTCQPIPCPTFPSPLPCVSSTPGNQLQGNGSPGSCFYVAPVSVPVTGITTCNNTPLVPVAGVVTLPPPLVAPASLTQILTGDGCTVPL